MKVFVFILLAFIWGGSYVAIKFVVAAIPPFWGASFRLMAAIFLLFIICKAMGKNISVAKSLRKRVWLCGLASQGIPFAFLFWGEKSISAGLAGILNGITPLWTFVFGLLFLKNYESFTLRKVVGLLLGIGGIFIIFAPKLSLGVSNSNTLGALAVAVMAMSYGLGNIINKGIMVHKDHPNLEASLFQQTMTSLVFITTLALLFEGLPHSEWLMRSDVVIATLYMGFISTAVAFLLFYRLINDWGALRAASIIYLIPLATVFLDFLINRNVPNLYDALGTGVILAGILFIQIKPSSVSLKTGKSHS